MNTNYMLSLLGDINHHIAIAYSILSDLENKLQPGEPWLPTVTNWKRQTAAMAHELYGARADIMKTIHAIEEI
jgi:hypothetical protein